MTADGARGGCRDLVILGSGGFARETAQAVQALNQGGSGWRLLGFLDDAPVRHGQIVDGLPVLGGRDHLSKLPEASLVVCTGRPDDYTSRMRIVGDLGLPLERYATIIHPTAAVSASSTVGPGSVLLAHAVLTASVRVGSHVAIMPHVTLTHDDVVEDFATLASGVRVGGGARISRAAYLGAGCLVRENRTIGTLALVGMGAVVVSDVPPGEVWVGAPARYLRTSFCRTNLPNRTVNGETSCKRPRCGSPG
jgi:sugar O-acyltransferase (sialic acid O-acetyltransferase NeuD family)